MTRLDILRKANATVRNLSYFTGNLLCPVLLLVALFSGIYPAVSQKTAISVDTTSILLGDQVKLKISIEVPEKAHVVFPVFNDTLTKDIEIIGREKIDTQPDLNTKNLIYSQKLIITAFDSGYFVVPPITFTYTLPGDTTVYTAQTEAMLLESKKVAVNEQEDIKDLKDIFDVPLTFGEVLPYILAALLAGVLIFLGIKYGRKLRKNEPILGIKKPELPPHIVALKALEELKMKKLWENNQIKEYYSELTDIIRLYIEKAMNVYAMEMTTEEIRNELIRINLNEELRKKLLSVLILADLVKFAKHQPIAFDHESCYNKCLEFVKETAPMIQTPAVTTTADEPSAPKEINNLNTDINNKTE
ncbi:MAG: hypothetical protein BWY70_00329 [Bacteroidetes bacterium ADurb.Bin408]|nr:MAG: hypothetical protein BWY70_00329 [Bacteroidetes bacterium ADurb.Bin408]